MADKKFERENRYVVLKTKNMTEAEKFRLADFMNEHELGRHHVTCVVVESDWPIYEQAWELVEKQWRADNPAFGEVMRFDANEIPNEDLANSRPHAEDEFCGPGEEDGPWAEGYSERAGLEFNAKIPPTGIDCQWLRNPRDNIWSDVGYVEYRSDAGSFLFREHGGSEYLLPDGTRFRKADKLRDKQISALHGITKMHQWSEGLTDEEAKDLIDSGVRVLQPNQFVANELTDEQKSVVYDRIIHCSKYGVMEVINAVITELKRGPE